MLDNVIRIYRSRSHTYRLEDAQGQIEVIYLDDSRWPSIHRQALNWELVDFHPDLGFVFEPTRSLSINEVARLKGVNPMTVRRHIWAGTLPATCYGEGKRKVWTISRQDAERWQPGRKASKVEG